MCKPFFSHPIAGFWSRFHCRRLHFSIKVLANKLEIFKHSPMSKIVHIQSTWLHHHTPLQ